MSNPEQRLTILVLFLLTVLTISVFMPVVFNDFVSYDDPLYVTENATISDGISMSGIRWAITAVHEGNWLPMTWLSHMLDVSLYGLNPHGHHFTSLLLHVSNTLLLFIILRSSTSRLVLSALTAALFSVHPLHVEAVAWVAERKELLSTFFGLLAVGAYIRYAKHFRIGDYLIVIIFFTLSLAAKPMWMTFPLLLLLIDYWPLGRIDLSKRSLSFKGVRNCGLMIYEKLPLFGLSFLCGSIAIYTQNYFGAVETLESFSSFDRITNALVSYGQYLINTVWPARLAVYYPHPAGSLPLWKPYFAGFVLTLITIWTFGKRTTRPYLVVGWAWYLISLIPVIGLIQIGTQARADRYTYMPLIGIFLAIVWWSSDLASEFNVHAVIRSVVSIFLVSSLSFLTTYQLRYWKNSVTLFERAMEVTEPNRVALINLGEAYSSIGDSERAEICYRNALALNPNDPKVLYNLGKLMEDNGDSITAASLYKNVLALNSEYTKAAINLAGLMMDKGEFHGAIDWYMKVLDAQPDSSDAHNNLAGALASVGRLELAEQHFKQAISLAPENSMIRCNYALLLKLEGRREEAVLNLSEAIRVRPEDVQPYCLMAKFLYEQRNGRQAEEFLKIANRIHSDGCRGNEFNNKKRNFIRF